MFRAVNKQTRGLLLTLAALTLVAAACSSGSSTAAPNKTGSNGEPAASVAPAGTGQAANNGGAGLAGAAGNFANVNSYKFKMTMAGGNLLGGLTSLLGGAGATGNGAMTVSGTVVTKPDKAADVTMAGFHIIEVGGFDYMDMGLGGFVKTAVTGSSMADSFSPSTMFSSSMSASTADGYTKVGSENKNGVDTDHYQATPAALAQYGSVVGVTGAVWSSDVWLAKDGGYPVSMAMIAKAADNSVAYEILFDLTDINSSANAVTAPTNVMGA